VKCFAGDEYFQWQTVEVLFLILHLACVISGSQGSTQLNFSIYLQFYLFVSLDSTCPSCGLCSAALMM
jgi:hypothetical protein